jgi:hypothetical protein
MVAARPARREGAKNIFLFNLLENPVGVWAEDCSNGSFDKTAIKIKKTVTKVD